MDSDIHEDAITIESLQAQIDMSMSFAQGLVSSWVKPSKVAGNSRKGLEFQLLESARHRPRLGVGATSTELLSSSKDIARLKDQLVRKKRTREEDDGKGLEDSEDQEESRAGAIKKKAKVDPFAKSQKTKKVLAPVESHVGEPLPDNPLRQEPMLLVPPSLKKKRNKNKCVGTLAVAGTAPDPDGGKPPQSLSSPLGPNPVVNPPVLGKPFQGSAPSISPSSILNKDGIKSSPSLLNGRESPQTNLRTGLLNKPLLNLEEISSESGLDDGAVNAQTSPRKKRRRRKRKKLSSAPSAEVVKSNQIKLLIS